MKCGSKRNGKNKYESVFERTQGRASKYKEEGESEMEAERQGQDEIQADTKREENAETGNRNECEFSQQKNPAGVFKTKSDRKPRRKRDPRLIEDGNTNAKANGME
jgi:hypothetical protein